MNLSLPAQYSKFLTALGAALLGYLQLYGATWHLVPAATLLGGALAVLGVPNSKPAAASPLPAQQPQVALPPPPAWPGGRAPGTQ